MQIVTVTLTLTLPDDQKPPPPILTLDSIQSHMLIGMLRAALPEQLQANEGLATSEAS